MQNNFENGVPEYITSGMAAKLCGVSKVTVLRWIHEGHLKAFKLPKGHHRIPRDEFFRFLKEHGMQLGEENSDT